MIDATVRIAVAKLLQSLMHDSAQPRIGSKMSRCDLMQSQSCA
jgi:hypothetical protein